MLIGSLANRSASDGIDVFLNLGYKKDAFLELSLVSNNFPSSPNKPISTIPTINATALYLIAPCPPTACNSNNKGDPLILLALAPGVFLLLLEVLLTPLISRGTLQHAPCAMLGDHLWTMISWEQNRVRVFCFFICLRN